MANSTAQRGGTRQSAKRRCPACGHVLDRLVDGRCELCRFQLEEAPVTSDDKTPYAESLESDGRGWWRMCRWVYFAGAERMSFLALTRLSKAARRFARINLLWLSFMALLVQLTQSGWYVRLLNSDIELAKHAVEGRGWVRLMTGPQGAELWWNAPVAVVAALAALFAAWIFGAWWMLCLDAGMQRTLRHPYREQGRLSAALRYSTAWTMPVVILSIPLIFLPLWKVSEVRGWQGLGSPLVVLAPVGIGLSAVAVLWWTWLVRLSLTVPMSTRTRTLTWALMGTPLLATVLLVAPAYAMHKGVPLLLTSLGLLE